MAAVANTGVVRSVVVLGYPGVQALDLVGPFEVFTGATTYLARQGRVDEGYTVTLASRDGEPASTLTGLALVAQPLPDPRDPIDTLVLPGAANGRHSARVEIAGVDFAAVDVRTGGVQSARIGNRLLSKFLVSIDYGRKVVALWRDPRIAM